MSGPNIAGVQPHPAPAAPPGWRPPRQVQIGLFPALYEVTQQPGPRGELITLLRLETVTGETVVTLDAGSAKRLGEELVKSGTAGGSGLVIAR